MIKTFLPKFDICKTRSKESLKYGWNQNQSDEWLTRKTLFTSMINKYRVGFIEPGTSLQALPQEGEKETNSYNLFVPMGMVAGCLS